MDALEFAKARRRLCNNYNNSCEGCPLRGVECVLGYYSKSVEVDQNIIEIVEKWAKEHSAKTKQSEFLKLFPNATMLEDGVLDICPKNLDADFKCHSQDGLDCNECERIYWKEEIE